MPATHGRWPRPWPHSSAVRYSSSENVEAPALQEPIERAGIASELETLVALHQKGVLTDGEFAAAKAKLLG